MKNFHCLSISHRKASFEERCKLSIPEQEINEFILKVKESTSIQELLVVSTCNRMEMYVSTEHISNIDTLKKLLGSFKGISCSEFEEFCTYYNGSDAVEHLFAVALGLESKVLGDSQIIYQIKRSYQISHDLEMASSFLHRLMHTIFFTNKRAVQETPIRDGQASLASAATSIAKQFSENFTTAKVLVIGLGEIGKDVIKNLASSNTEVTLMNRTLSKALDLAEKLGLKAVPISALLEEINEADVVISAVGVPEPIIEPQMLDKTAYQKIFIDLGVPRTIDPSIKELENIELYNVDELGNLLEHSLIKRQKAIPQVKQIISESLTDFAEWSFSQAYTDSLSEFKARLNEIRMREMAKFTKQLNQEDIDKFQAFSESMINQIVKLPALNLKSACQRGNANGLSKGLKELFDIENKVLIKE